MRLLCFFILFFSVQSIADPFYAELESSEDSQPIARTKNPENLTACQPSHTVNFRYLTDLFNELKLVGIIKNKEIYTALFLNKENKLIDLHIDDFIVASQIQVEDINFKQVQVIDWQNSQICSQPKRKQIEL